jgi:hypothetical protein
MALNVKIMKTDYALRCTLETLDLQRRSNAEIRLFIALQPNELLLKNLILANP